MAIYLYNHSPRQDFWWEGTVLGHRRGGPGERFWKKTYLRFCALYCSCCIQLIFRISKYYLFSVFIWKQIFATHIRTYWELLTWIEAWFDTSARIWCNPNVVERYYPSIVFKFDTQFVVYSSILSETITFCKWQYIICIMCTCNCSYADTGNKNYNLI